MLIRVTGIARHGMEPGKHTVHCCTDSSRCLNYQVFNNFSKMMSIIPNTQYPIEKVANQLEHQIIDNQKYRYYYSLHLVTNQAQQEKKTKIQILSHSLANQIV